MAACLARLAGDKRWYVLLFSPEAERFFMILEEVGRLVKAALPKGRCQGIKVYILPRVLSTDELCAAEPWIRFVLAEEVAHRLWVAFVDEEPGVAWDHRSRLLLVDDEIAEVLIDLSMHFSPSFLAEMQPLL